MFKKSVSILKIFLILIFLICSISTVYSADINQTNNIISINNSMSIQDTVNNASVNDIIYLNPGTYQEAGISINKNLTLIGNGSREDVIIDGNRQDSIFILKSNKASVTFINITFINGYSKYHGGAIDNELSKIYVDNCVFINNTNLNNNGGGISSTGTVKLPHYLFVNNSLFVGNYAGNDGGALFHLYGIADIYNSIFIENYAFRDGGAIGGGVYSKTNIYACEFYENYALEWGGAVYIWQGTSKIVDSIFISNEAGTRGGAFTTSGQLTVTGSVIKNNTAGEYGGAFYISDCCTINPDLPLTVTAKNNVIIGNDAPEGTVTYILKMTTNTSEFSDNDYGDDINDQENMIRAHEDVPTNIIPSLNIDTNNHINESELLNQSEHLNNTLLENKTSADSDNKIDILDSVDLNHNLDLSNSTNLNISEILDAITQELINSSEILDTIAQELTQSINNTDLGTVGISDKKAHNLIVDKNVKKTFGTNYYEILIVLIIFALICIVGYKKYKI